MTLKPPSARQLNYSRRSRIAAARRLPTPRPAAPRAARSSGSARSVRAASSSTSSSRIDLAAEQAAREANCDAPVELSDRGLWLNRDLEVGVMSVASARRTGARTEFARYTVPEGERSLYGQRVGGVVRFLGTMADVFVRPSSGSEDSTCRAREGS
jgi:hypothetical protein